LAPQATATIDSELVATLMPAEEWRDWPIVPTVTAHAIEIYRQGLTMGLDPHAFSKVGDCQSVKAAFMGYFDVPERYSLGDHYAYLQETIDNFAGHFNTDGQAVRGGFNAAAVLSPLWADPGVCLAGETPLDCELRITKPIIVFVSLEVWWDGRTPEQYEKLMRQILDTIIAHGAVPILATKADNVEGDNSLNLTTAELAYEYDLPLWNFWAAVQPLPYHGMDMLRNDGFHISTDAWSTRSFTALEALDSVWRGLLAAGPASATAPTLGMSTATPNWFTLPAQTPVPTLPPIPGATPLGGSQRIVFGLQQRQGEEYQYTGVFLFDLSGRQTTQVFGAGVRFQSASPDGRYLLVSEGSSLYRTNVDGADPVKLTDSLYSFGDADAAWLPDGQVAAILTKPGGTDISILSAEGEMINELPISAASPIELYPSTDGKFVYWESGSCTAPGICQQDGTWVTALDGSTTHELEGFSQPALAPDGSLLALTVASSTTQSGLTFALPDGSNPDAFPLPGSQTLDYAWSPSGDELAVIVAQVSGYSGRTTGSRNFLVNPHTQAISEFPQSDLLNPRLIWSPDGSYLFRIGTLPTDNGYEIGGSLLDRTTKQTTNMTADIGLSSLEYPSITNATWLPLP